MQKIFSLFLGVFLFISFGNCQKNSKTLSDTNLFVDGFSDSTGLKLFTLLDGYPSLKQAFKSLDPIEFNNRLGTSLLVSHRVDNLGSLRLLQNILLNTQTELQTLLRETSNALNRIQNNNPTAYQNILPVINKIRTYHKPVIRNLIPVTTSYLKEEYDRKSITTITNQVNDFANSLQSADTIQTLEDYQDVVVKAIRLNPIIRQAIEDATNALLLPEVGGDQKLRDGFIGIVYGLGEMFFKRTGPSDNLTSETTIKRLMVNAERYFTVGGSAFTGIYSATYSSPVTIRSTELNTLFIDLFTTIREFIVPPAVPRTKDLNAILIDKIGQNLQLLDFVGNTTGMESSFLDLLLQDSNGKNRNSDGTSYPISALENLLLTLAIVDYFGFTWDTSTTTNEWITGMSHGQLNLGDSLWAMQSVIQSASNINFKAILNISKSSGKVFKNGIALTGVTGIDLNTPELSLLEAESIGAARPIELGGTDNIYRKTIPWVLNWIVRVTYSGYGPYYNKNKTDSSGNFLAPDGTIARYANLAENHYKPTWQTANYKICIQNSTTERDIGMGGMEYTNCNSANTGTGFTIYEISKTNTERAVNSDEEAFYKNFQWLLYEKRFVVIIPARAKLDASLAFEESLFIIAIGNGLKGMMSLKPYCSGSASASCGGDSNGKWLKNPSVSLRDNTASYKNFTANQFSSLPGDAVVYLEGWGYGAAGNLPFEEALVLQSNLVWPLLIPDPDYVFGLIPPVISFNFPVLEKLGFTSTGTVLASATASNWTKRNKLLPLIVGLAKSLDDQVDVPTNKNPYTLLTDLSKILSRPFFFVGPDLSIQRGTQYGTPPNIVDFRTAYGDEMRAPSGVDASDYQPNPAVFSPISFLVDSTRRFQDGALFLVAKTDLLTSLVHLFVAMGAPEKQTGKDIMLTSIQQILGEIKIDSDGPTAANQYNLQLFISEKITKLANYPDTRSSDITHTDWDGVNDSLAFVRDYFSESSGYSLVKSLDFLMEMIIDLRLTSSDVTSIFEMIDALLTEETNGNYYLTNVLSEYVPPVLRQTAPYGRNLYGVFYGLAISGGFFDYAEKNMTFAPYSVQDVVTDLERILVSNMIQTQAKTTDSLFYSTGVLISLFADIYQFGNKMQTFGFPFADSLNVGEDSSAWHRFNIIFSIK